MLKITGNPGKSCVGKVVGTDAKPKRSKEWVVSEEMKTDFPEIWLQKGDLGLRDFHSFLVRMSSSSTICCKDCSFRFPLPWHLWQILDCSYTYESISGLFIVLYWSVCQSLCQYYTVLITGICIFNKCPWKILMIMSVWEILYKIFLRILPTTIYKSMYS